MVANTESLGAAAIHLPHEKAASAIPQAHPHLVELATTERWGLWRWVGLRGAGFPLGQVCALADTACAAASDALLDLEETEYRLRFAVVAALKREVREADDLRRRPLMAKMQQVKKGRLIAPSDESADTVFAINSLRDASTRLDAARQTYEARYAEAALRGACFIHETARSPLFLEALTWQNRQAARRGIESLLKREPGTALARQRRNEAMVAGYLQRYCTKNETIGFFGPVGWARFTDDGEAMEQRPGRRLLARRSVYFEHWCIDALATVFAADERVRRHLKVRLMPYVRVEGGVLHQPLEEPRELEGAERALLEGCRGGDRTAFALATELAARGVAGCGSEGEVYEQLETLCRRRLICWSLEIPMQIRPEASLRHALDALPDEPLRRETLASLNELEAARVSVQRAAGDPASLDAALASLEAVFTRLTGSAATRSAGRTYAGRTLVYEDCRRDIEADLGPQLRQRLATPLSLLLKSARWMTAEVARLYREAFRKIYDELSESGGAVEAVEFWMRAQRLLFGERGSLATGVAERLQERWAKVLGERIEGKRRVRFRSEELEAAVEEAFGGVRRGWRSARYHSPDVMIAAEDEEAVRRGEYELVLGEMHVGVNTLGAGSFVEQHPRAEELYAAVSLDLPEPRVVPSYSKHWPRANARTNLALLLDKDFYFEASADAPTPAGTGVLAISDLVVEQSGASLRIRSRSLPLSFDIIDFFGEALNLSVVSSFRLLPPRSHAPRINFDHLVVSRESWRLTASDADWVRLPVESERFLSARRWQRRHAMPRAVFVKLPTEVKPFYVDFESVAYVTALGRAVQRMAEGGGAEQWMVVTEMLPGLEQAWLRDGEGQRYTSELRLAAVDLS